MGYALKYTSRWNYGALLIGGTFPIPWTVATISCKISLITALGSNLRVSLILSLVDI